MNTMTKPQPAKPHAYDVTPIRHAGATDADMADLMRMAERADTLRIDVECLRECVRSRRRRACDNDVVNHYVWSLDSVIRECAIVARTIRTLGVGMPRQGSTYGDAFHEEPPRAQRTRDAPLNPMPIRDDDPDPGD